MQDTTHTFLLLSSICNHVNLASLLCFHLSNISQIFTLAKPYQATVEEGVFAYFEFQFHPKVGIYSPHHHNLPLVNLVSLYTSCNHI